MYTLLFGGIGVVAFLTFFLTRPLQALEENLQFITLAWSDLQHLLDTAGLHDQPGERSTGSEAATSDSIKKLKDLLETHAERSSKRPGLR
jgi:hypothetical protein